MQELKYFGALLYQCIESIALRLQGWRRAIQKADILAVLYIQNLKCLTFCKFCVNLVHYYWPGYLWNLCS